MERSRDGSGGVSAVRTAGALGGVSLVGRVGTLTPGGVPPRGGVAGLAGGVVFDLRGIMVAGLVRGGEVVSQGALLLSSRRQRLAKAVAGVSLLVMIHVACPGGRSTLPSSPTAEVVVCRDDWSGRRADLLCCRRFAAGIGSLARNPLPDKHSVLVLVGEAESTVCSRPTSLAEPVDLAFPSRQPGCCLQWATREINGRTPLSGAEAEVLGDAPRRG